MTGHHLLLITLIDHLSLLEYSYKRFIVARVLLHRRSLSCARFQRLPPDVVDEFARVDRVHCDQSRRVFTFKYRLHEHQPTAVLNSLLSRVSFGYFCSDFCLILVTHREARGRLWS